ncbi:uncharacterized protein F4812DRAFT_468112 [Daldinia caldariorum]|uniref:uncharacterized protein n=1 Tax=Daldinia caldariorum TaxID=326644 RepID=UPI0020082656|nr:uncharacterized protein F4812DRAFT_468112 [Daldinia caldariorum]KAI1464154.1 hypothetical protein F4812DRAFT_468112 [Daldinia caldariorum]
MASFQVGFYTIIILAGCKLILIALEFFSITLQQNARHLRVLGYLSSFLALLLGCLSFIGLRARGPDEPGQCDNADADIVGDGVRAAAWTQVGILFFITLTGIWHICKTAVKEIGGGLIITHVSLAIALLVPLARRELSPIDAILGSLILDAQGNSLSIQLVTKETLAARWQVVIVLIAQLLGLIIEGILVGNFTRNLRPTSDCDCFSAFWWAWLSNCPSDSPNDVEPFWIYFGYRFVNIVHGAYFAATRTTTYDDAEKWDRENPCDSCDICKKAETPSIYCSCHLCEECHYCKVCKRRMRGLHEKRCANNNNNLPKGGGDSNNHASNSAVTHNNDSNDHESHSDITHNDETSPNNISRVSSLTRDDNTQRQNGHNGVPPPNGNNSTPINGINGNCIPLQTLNKARVQNGNHEATTPHAGDDGESSRYEESACEMCIACQRCHKCGHIDLEAGQAVLLVGERYSEVPVTVSVNFLESSVLALLSMISAEVTMSINMVQKTSPLYSVGQVTALIIAGGTAIRALWVFLYMFDGRSSHSAY